MTQRITKVLIHPQPVSLSPAELDTNNDEVTTPARVEGHAFVWTSRSVHVEWVDGNGETQRAWVWSTAVEKA